MLKRAKTGFSLIEIIMVLAIIGIMASLIIPRVKRSKNAERAQFATQLNALTRYAYNNALLTGAVHQIYFDFIGEPYVEVRKAHQEKAGAPVKFEPLADYKNTHITWPKQFVIKNFFIMGKDDGTDLKTAWFFLMPDGLAQPLVMNIQGADEQDMFGLVLDPFSAQFTVYDEPQKP